MGSAGTSSGSAKNIPAVVAWRLHRAWPGSELVIDEGDGHGGTAIVREWRAANTRDADRIDAEPDVR